jgi:hypothetical protein
MNNSTDCLFQLMKQFDIKSSIGDYILCALFIALIIRAFLCIFKAWAVINGELDKEDKSKIICNKQPWKGQPYWSIFLNSFFSNKKDVMIDDYWLPAIVGFAELLVFPILMSIGKWIFIGAWMGIKTASSWGGWQNYRTAYNRFLLGNILSVMGSVIVAFMFLK